MKKLLLIPLMLLIISTGSFSQQTDNPVPALAKQDYLHKSKKQKTTAWVLLGGGAALYITGFIIFGSQDKSGFNDVTSGEVIGAIGAVSAVASIPFFIASGKNKRKAISMSFKMQQMPQLQHRNFANRSIPSLALKISLSSF